MGSSLYNSADLVIFSDDVEWNDIAEIHLTGTETREVDGFVQKDILRTGEWPVIPTRDGLVKRPLKIVRDGKSDKKAGVISLAEVVENFKSVGLNVQIPLSDDDDDHKNITALNTGYVRDIWIVDENDGSKLVAKLEFTEPDVKDKVLRGTYRDVSCGIPWEISSRGQKYGSTLEHVAITNRPFIDGLGPFLAMSDRGGSEVTHFSTPEIAEREVVDPFGGLSMKEIMEQAESSLTDQLKLSESFKVIDIRSSGLVVNDETSGLSWVIPFSVDEERKLLVSVEGWTFVQGEGEVEPAGGGNPPSPPQETPPETPAPPKRFGTPEENELDAARRVRQMRLSASDSNDQGGTMPLTREELDALNLSDMPESQRAAFQKILDENSTLAASTREGEADKRVAELSDLGFKEKPGALKLYRDVMLADDGGPAVVLSENGTKKSETALSILDKFIDAIKGAEGKVVLSDQALVSGNDDPPPANPEGETKPVADRVAEVREALFGPKK